jgi:Holliday junction resolvase RusA-like endonuclease
MSQPMALDEAIAEMDKRITLVFPGVPVPKARARSVLRRGKVHTYTPDTTEAWEQRIRTDALAALSHRALRGNTWDKSGRFGLIVTVWPYQREKLALAALKAGHETFKGDWDNYGKAASDALNGVLWHDDCQVKSAHCIVQYPGPRPGIEVVVERIPFHTELPHAPFPIYEPAKRTREPKPRRAKLSVQLGDGITPVRSRRR